MIEHFLTLLGFREKPASLLAWGIILFSLCVGLTVFFLSYSLARHKRLVGELRVQIISYEAERQKREAEKKTMALRLELVRIEQQKETTRQHKEKLKEEIHRKLVEEERRKTVLDSQIRKLDGKSLQQLVDQAEKLEKETL